MLRKLNCCCPGVHSADQAGPELRDLPASAFPVMRLKACTCTFRDHFNRSLLNYTQWKLILQKKCVWRRKQKIYTEKLLDKILKYTVDITLSYDSEQWKYTGPSFSMKTVCHISTESWWKIWMWQERLLSIEDHWLFYSLTTLPKDPHSSTQKSLSPLSRDLKLF